jgi:hypothetical protein
VVVHAARDGHGHVDCVAPRRAVPGGLVLYAAAGAVVALILVLVECGMWEGGCSRRGMSGSHAEPESECGAGALRLRLGMGMGMGA